MHNLKPTRLHQLKAKAAILLKEFKHKAVKPGNAAQRFINNPLFANKTIEWLTGNINAIQLKHAYQVIAFEHGFTTWTALKQKVVDSDCLYKPAAVAFIHAWFTTYNKASAYHKQYGGYLLVFWDDFIVCGKEYINALGLAHLEEQWKKIGCDWAQPLDEAAWQLLYTQAKQNYLANN